MREAIAQGAGDGHLDKVKAFLAAQAVGRVGIVDDGFDVTDEDDVKGAWKAFVEHAGATPKLWNEMKRLELDPDGDEEPEAISTMEAAIQQADGTLAKELQRRMKKHSPAHKQAKAGVKNLTQLLETRLELKLVKLGTDAEGKAADLVESQIVFLDYFLGTEDAAGVANAVAVVKKVCAACDGKRKPRPMFVLFSSKDLQKHEFTALRRRAKIPAWQFRFIAKKNLARDVDIVLRVWELAQGLKGVRSIQGFLEGFKVALDKGQLALKKTLNDLDLSDVSYLDLMKLNDERASRSHYLTWLFGAFLQNALLRDKAFEKAQQALDDVDFTLLPTRHAEPSQQVLDLYKDVLYEPGRPKTGRADDGTKAPRLQLGEIYVRKRGVARDALLVLNNSCDLLRPAKGLGVVLLRGAVVKRRNAETLNSPKKTRSDAFGMDGKHCVLDWTLDGSENQAHEDVFKWLKRKKYRLAARMRMENALGIKQMYLAQLDRIGLPTSPPMLTKMRVTGVYWRDGANKAQQLLEKSAADSMDAFSLDTHSDTGKRSERFGFTSEFLAQVSNAIQEKFKANSEDANLKALDKWCRTYSLLTLLLQPRTKASMDPVSLAVDASMAVNQALGNDHKKLVICLEYPTT